MKIAVEGCAHGELDNIYDTIKSLEEAENIKVDLLLCCGDFQSARNFSDLNCMAIPQKYHSLQTFYKYYNGEKKAPILTIFIGGNHEASNYLQELPYGGWVAPNIYYLGYAGIVNVGGLRIGGVSGIFKGHDYTKGHHEIVPYAADTMRSVYHQRNLEIFRMKQLSNPVDIFLSHDWPNNVFKHGNLEQLLRFKPFLRNDVESDNIGSPPLQELMMNLQPSYWFAAHLHCKYAALIPHESTNKVTKFLALDKCLPKKRFMQIIDIPHDESKGLYLNYDLEWLAILQSTNHLLSIKSIANYMPGPQGSERWQFTPDEDELIYMKAKFGEDLKIPENFTKTLQGHREGDQPTQQQPPLKLNPQTKLFCSKIGIDDPIELLIKAKGITVNTDEINETIAEEETSVNVSQESRRFSSLNLPPPKFDNSTEQSDEQNISKVLDDNIDSTSEDASKESTMKTTGVLKRRNASLYENE